MDIARGLKAMPDGTLWPMKARALVAWNVRRIRVDRGIPQEKLARDTGIDRSYLAGLERQSKNPTIDLLDRVAESLGVHLSEFFVQPSKGVTTHGILPKDDKPGPHLSPQEGLDNALSALAQEQKFD